MSIGDPTAAIGVWEAIIKAIWVAQFVIEKSFPQSPANQLTYSYGPRLEKIELKPIPPIPPVNDVKKLFLEEIQISSKLDIE